MLRGGGITSPGKVFQGGGILSMGGNFQGGNFLFNYGGSFSGGDLFWGEFSGYHIYIIYIIERFNNIAPCLATSNQGTIYRVFRHTFLRLIYILQLIQL